MAYLGTSPLLHQHREPNITVATWCFRALFDAVGSLAWLAIPAALIEAAWDSAPQWPLRLSAGTRELERSIRLSDWRSTTLFNMGREHAEAH